MRAETVAADLKLKEREAEKQRLASAADLLRLGGQAPRAHQEAAVHAHRAEEAKRIKEEADASAAAETEQLWAQAETIMADLKHKEREAGKERLEAQAMRERFGNLSVRAHQEAGVLAERARKAHDLSDGLKMELRG
ncbi:MAG: hypothetical protein SGPRY_014985, partial [Prymnesium sp.]